MTGRFTGAKQDVKLTFCSVAGAKPKKKRNVRNRNMSSQKGYTNCCTLSVHTFICEARVNDLFPSPAAAESFVLNCPARHDACKNAGEDVVISQ